MNEEEIIEKLRDIIKPYVPDAELMNNLNPQSDLIKDLKINSAHVVDIVLDTESVFDIVIDDESINKMDTLANVVSLIQEKLQSKK